MYKGEMVEKREDGVIRKGREPTITIFSRAVLGERLEEASVSARPTKEEREKKKALTPSKPVRF
jgi:hypothetical protein